MKINDPHFKFNLGMCHHIEGSIISIGIVFSGSQYFLGVAPMDSCRTEQQSSSITSYEMPFLTENGELNNFSTTFNASFTRRFKLSFNK
jgi:hypothetical protein